MRFLRIVWACIEVLAVTSTKCDHWQQTLFASLAISKGGSVGYTEDFTRRRAPWGRQLTAYPGFGAAAKCFVVVLSYLAVFAAQAQPEIKACATELDRSLQCAFNAGASLGLGEIGSARMFRMLENECKCPRSGKQATIEHQKDCETNWKAGRAVTDPKYAKSRNKPVQRGTPCLIVAPVS